MRLAALTLAVSAAACHPEPAKEPAPEPRAPAHHPKVDMPRTELTRRLMADDFGPVFYWPQHDATIAKIWAEPGNPQQLEAIVADRNSPGRARVLAAEVLFTNDISFLGRVDGRTVAEVYAEALAKNYTGHANPWGLLWENDRPGPVGVRFLMLGEAAVPALRALLDDSAIVDWYAGSEEATVGNAARYRIKDFAAYYLGEIRGRQVPFHRDHAGRDAEIAKLREALDAR